MRRIILSSEKASIDGGVMFGRGVFSTLYVKEKPLFLNEHIERIKNNMEVIGLSPLIEETVLREEIKKLNIKNKILKIVVTEENIILAQRENTYKDEIYLNGVELNISKIRKNETSRLNNVKSLNYLENILIKEEAIKEGVFDSILLNTKGNVTETSSSNIFSVKNGEIITPNLECGLLSGIVRGFIVDNFNVSEAEVTLEDFLESDEIFITNSVFGVIKVNKIGDRLYNNEKYYFKVRKFYEDYIEKLGGETNGG